MPLIRHLPPRLLQYPHNLILIMFLLKSLKLIVQENETCHILQHHCLLIGLQVFLPYQTSHCLAILFTVSRIQAYLLNELGLAFLEVGAPGVVARACHWVAGSRHFPAAEVLGADCYAEG